MPSKTKAVTRYVILHDAVGSFMRGEVVRSDKFPPGVDADRLAELLHVGAIGLADDLNVADTSDATLGGTVDPLRTENPPTLPQAGVPNMTTPIPDDLAAPAPAV